MMLDYIIDSYNHGIAFLASGDVCVNAVSTCIAPIRLKSSLIPV